MCKMCTIPSFWICPNASDYLKKSYYEAKYDYSVLGKTHNVAMYDIRSMNHAAMLQYMT